MVRISRALLIIHLQWVWIVDSLYIELIGGLNGTNTTECNSNVTLRCRANPASGEAVWKIAETIDLNTPIAADCFGTPCDTFNTFGGRYNYTYDQSTGIADIFITPANSIDDGMSFHCYDYQSENIFPFSVKMFPKENTSTQSTSELTMNVISGCTVNAGNITFTWYSEMVNETGLQFIMNNSAPDIATEHCVCESNCSGRCFFDSFNVEKHTFATEEGEYYIYCYITSTDPDMPAISPKKSDHPFVFKLSSQEVCEERLCIPCWGFIIILSVFSVVSLLVICANEYYEDGEASKPCSIIIGLLMVPHVAVTIAARFCKDETSCDDSRCLPCWVFCILVTETFLLAVLHMIISDGKTARVISSIAETLKTAVVVVGIVLASALCEGVEEEDEECDPAQGWVYGLILGVIFFMTIGVTFCTKKFCSSDGKRLCKRWEMAFRTGISIFIIFGIFAVILAGRFKRCIDGVGLLIPHWVIYLIVCSVTLFLYIVLIVVYGLKVPPPGITGLCVEHKTDTSLALRFDVPQTPSSDTYPVKYVIEYGTANTSNEIKRLETVYTNHCKIENLKPKTSYAITIYAENKFGRSETSKPVVVETRASEDLTPSEFQCTATREEDVTLTWRPCPLIDNQTFILAYQLNNKMTKQTVAYDGREVIDYTVTGLDPGTDYMFNLSTCVGQRTLEISKVISVTTKGIKPPSAFKYVSTSEGDVTLSWVPGSNIERQEFRLVYSVKGSEQTKKVKYNSEDREVRFTVKKLEPGTEYVFELASVVGKGIFKTSTPVCAKTKELHPPSDFKCTGEDEESVTLSWKPSSKVRRQKFCLKYLLDEKVQEIVIGYKGEKRMEYTVHELYPETEYKFVLAALIGEKSSDFTSEICAETGVLKAPSKFRVTKVGKRSISLEWKPLSSVSRQEFCLTAIYEDRKDIKRIRNDNADVVKHRETSLKQDTNYIFVLFSAFNRKTSDLCSALFINTTELKLENALVYNSDEMMLQQTEDRHVQLEAHGKSFGFKCKDVSEDDATLEWKSGSDTVEESFCLFCYNHSGGKAVISIDKSSKDRQYEYTLKDLDQDTEYKLNLVAVADKTTFKHPAVLRINTKKLEPPTEFQCVNVSETNVKLQWKPSSSKTTQKFKITYKTRETNGEETIDYTEGPVIQHTVEHLEPGTKYMFELVTVLGENMSQNVANLRTETKELEPPSTFQYKVVRENDITLLWRPSSSNSNQQFKLTYKSDKRQDENMIEYTGSPVIEHLVTDLEPGTLYFFDLFTVVGDKVSKKASRQRVKTKDCSPIPTEEVDVED